MSTWISAASGSRATTRTYKVDKTADVLPPPSAQAEVTSLEIAADDEVGCDPYNRTGSHCVDTLKELADE